MAGLFACLLSRRRVRQWAEAIAHWPMVGPVWLMVRANQREVVRFLKFALVGTLGAVVDFTLLIVMKRLFESAGLGVGWRLGVEARQIQLVAANTISFSMAVLSNFTWNRLWTFPESRDRPVGRQLVQFAIVNVIGWGINTLLLLLLDRYVFQSLVSDRMSYILAKAVAIGVVLFWNFGLNRIWTYRGIE